MGAYLIDDVYNTYGEETVLAVFLKGVSCRIHRYSASSKRSDYENTSSWLVGRMQSVSANND